MTGSAVKGRVCAEKREAILVIVDLLYRNVPAIHGMALFTTRSELAFVNVRMTVGALGSHIRKNRFGVALRTAHILVKATERKLGLVMIEFGNRADRLPALRCMTILTGK